ncbi:hypothetical protein CLAFUW4_09246 [Fulvia fulva]|uniref:Uncharacterized protein n=1 Tax=Passalora fulva TaxID=5499 RepID=A0A9Q8PFQ9_PASFU|nr:uncharacterized protein CLAFUR5_09347 [Fulvia fulva]KAK4613816.1 hypothetical protein CLAFUR4_09252 [Fulvia fulva]KAK4614412.1 hypothetical protein CLAFUR0_09244 [Fulvia fulva]UJO21601.1 hypothetical protein CLAFUR5_09347 [Fulvia fulva]WPV20336.1 hypothetical protein CLAFUW4_09246 [Fulvia fulva]WPV35524.1 hypothetical protein CLAFUW7_09247 [Fulvia fulva]
MPKIIVVGDVNGQLTDVFTKLGKLHAKNAFAFAIIAGNLFSDPDLATEEQDRELANLLGGNIEVQLPTYFALGQRVLPTAVIEKLTSDAGELCPNLFVLGRKVKSKTSEGFKLVAIGGRHTNVAAEAMHEYSAIYTDKDIESAKAFEEADILITSDWPAEIRDGSRAATVLAEAPEGVPGIGELCTALKPRYHLSTSSQYYEREPFFHQGEQPRSVTRFLSLAPLNNPQKQKAVYAFNLEPSAPPPQQIPDGCTASPFTSTRKRKLESQEDSFNGFRYSHGGNGNGYQERHHKRPKQQREPLKRECFFCLSNRETETHMITSIADDAYMTIAKGPLSTKSTFPGLKHPLNMLIIPLFHAPTFAAVEDGESCKKTMAEMQRYREALHTLVATKSTTGAEGEAKLGAVTWEISKGSGVHLHWQFMPVPVDMIKRSLVEAAFDVEAEHLSYPKFAKTEAEIKEAEEGDYFKVMIWSESIQKEVVLPLEKGLRFDLQFGRRVLGKLLGLENRAHWRDCIQTSEEEEQDANAFKEVFKEYDFTLEE